MLPQERKSQADELRRGLATRGWEVTLIEQPFEEEWWAAEFWVIGSAWRPQGVRVYLTFLVDPMGQGDDVWAVHASTERFRQRPLDDTSLLRLGHGWQKTLRTFIESLDRFRVAWLQEYDAASTEPPTY